MELKLIEQSQNKDTHIIENSFEDSTQFMKIFKSFLIYCTSIFDEPEDLQSQQDIKFAFVCLNLLIYQVQRYLSTTLSQIESSHKQILDEFKNIITEQAIRFERVYKQSQNPCIIELRKYFLNFSQQWKKVSEQICDNFSQQYNMNIEINKLGNQIKTIQDI
ncbi:hypothetical protein ABPG72_017517 [Tetrahymena utriculariae]